MGNYYKMSKRLLNLGLCTLLVTFISCENKVDQKNNITQNNVYPEAKPDIRTGKYDNFSTGQVLDWTSSRVYRNESKNAFSTKASSDSLKTKLGNTQNFLDSTKIINNTKTVLTGRITTKVGITSIEGNQTNFNLELKPGDKILVENTGEILEISSIPPSPTPVAPATTVDKDVLITMNMKTAPTKATKDSTFRVYLNNNERGKNFGAMTTSPAIDLNGTGTGDDVLYYTSDNKTGANFFAIGSDGRTIWEHGFNGTFINSAPTFSFNPSATQQKAFLGKKLMYVMSSQGDLYCLNSDGNQVSQIKVNDTFMNSVWVDATDPNFDYIYATSMNGNLYKFKLQLSNSQQASFSLEYSKKIDSVSFVSSPVMNGSSLYLGGENGIMYDVITTTGDVSRSWDLSLYNKNGSAKITGNPVVGQNSIVLVPSGGYLFRIQGSNVEQSPLLELKYDLNSRNKPYGAVFQNSNSSYPTGNISSSPIVNGNTTYISNGNVVFELDYSSNDTFKGKANYCLSASSRLDENSGNLTPYGRNNINLTTSNGVTKVAMLDSNPKLNSTPYINFFSTPFSSDKDSLSRYGYFNEFDSSGRATTGRVTSAISDTSGNVYFTLDNGTLNISTTP